MIFATIDSSDQISVLDNGKVADVILLVMSTKGTDLKNLRYDPDQFANAIDLQGYRNLQLLRNQGLPNLLGVLQHLETLPSKKQPQVKKLFSRYFVSEFTDQYKFMTMNTVTEQTCYNDANALLRQLAVTYPQGLDWRQLRSYMLVDKWERLDDAQVAIQGYIRGNLLSVNRCLQMTGSKSVFSIDRIELAKDLCP
jgi:pre-rRNA-processing protein TSR1